MTVVLMFDISFQRMSLAIRGDTILAQGPYRKDVYLFNDITKLRIEASNGAELTSDQLFVHSTSGAIQKYRATLKHEGGLVVTYTRDGIEHYQPLNPAIHPA